MTTQFNSDKLIQSIGGNCDISNLTLSDSVFSGILTANSNTSVSLPATSNVKFNGTTLSTTLNSCLPSGIIVFWSGATSNIPTGWVLCNGANNTIDLRNLFVISKSKVTDSPQYAYNTSGGSTVRTLTDTNIPQHSHGGTTGGMSANANHSHNVDIGKYASPPVWNVVGTNKNGKYPPSDGGLTSTDPNGYNGNGYSTEYTTLTHNHGTFITGNGTGSGQPFSIMPPYYALAYIMKS